MNALQFSILSTLALYAAEGRSALTQNEIYLYLHISLSFPPASPKLQRGERKRESGNTNLGLDSLRQLADRGNDKMKENHRKPAEKEFADCIAELQKSGLIFKEGDYYSLENRPGIAGENIKKARQSTEKIKKNEWPLWFLRAVPFARAIAVTGSVAMQNARPTSDLDLLIITQKGRIWTARIVALLILEIFKRRREKSKEKICLNFFVAEGAVAPVQNIASANMLARAVPLFGVKKYREFIAQNKWMENFIYSPTRITSENEQASLPARFFEYFLSGRPGDALEKFFKDWQYRRFLKKINSPEHLDHFVLTDEILMLHYPNPKNARIMVKLRVDR